MPFALCAAPVRLNAGTGRPCWAQYKPAVQMSTGDLVEANIQPVSGCLATGTGYEDLRKLQVWQGISTMMPATYVHYKPFWGEHLLVQAKKSMQKARAVE